MPPAEQRTLLAGSRLQLGLRMLLSAFVIITLVIERPHDKFGLCMLIVGVYLAIVAAWSVWALTPRRAVDTPSAPIAFAVLLADVAVVASITAITGIASPDSWTSDLLREGLFLVPIIAAAQLSVRITAVMAVLVVLAQVVANWINQAANEEPWPPIILHATLLATVACGSVMLSYIQRDRVTTIRNLLVQRTALLDEMIGLEMRQQTELSERLHDGALQSVLAARYDLTAIRSGSTEAIDRMSTTLTDAVHLLRDVVRELHPEVLNRSGLRTAVEQLATTVAERGGLTVDLDADGWPDAVRTDADPLLFSCARELTNNVVKHAAATTVQISLELTDGLGRIAVRDDGHGMADVDLNTVVEDGHIGLAAIRTKVRAAEGEFDIDSGPHGTLVTVTVPLRPTA
ncbi:ATP-binding protein [Mycobacterium sp. NBC_00419]|uniref:sensor histidine kinase n=1 Tax=Mycobacterium sp. NBC_00419 TaxID=2975989 RepID=UPI002E202C94